MASARDKREERRERVDAGETASERLKESGSRTVSMPKGASFFSLKKAGVYRIDIIPYRVTIGKGEPGGNPRREKGKLAWERTIHVHRDVGPGKDAYICPRKCKGQRCAVCDDIGRLAQDPDVDPEMTKAMMAKERQLFNVIDLAEPDKGIQIWDISYHLFGKLLYEMLDTLDEEDKNRRYFADPMEGMTLKLTAVEKPSPKGKFCEVKAIEFKDRREQYDDDIVEKAYDLDRILKIPTPDDLRKAYFGEDAEKPKGQDDEDTKPKGKSSKDDDDDDSPPPPKRKAPPKDEDDDDDDSPPPKPKAKKAEQTAEDLGIEIGTKVEYDGKEWEVFHISGDGSSLRLKNLEDEDEVERGVDPNECTVLKMQGKPKAKPADDDDDDEDSKTPPRKSGKDTSAAAKKRSTDDDDDDDDTDDDTDDDDDDDAPPPPKAKGGKTGSAAPSKGGKKPPADDDDWD